MNILQQIQPEFLKNIFKEEFRILFDACAEKEIKNYQKYVDLFKRCISQSLCTKTDCTRICTLPEAFTEVAERCNKRAAEHFIIAGWIVMGGTLLLAARNIYQFARERRRQN